MNDDIEKITAEKFSISLHIPIELLDDHVITPPTAQEADAARKRREAQRAAEAAAADADWRRLYEEFAHVRAVKAVLELHRPEDSVYGLVCTHPVSGWEADPETWPCPTYTAIRDAQEAP